MTKDVKQLMNELTSAQHAVNPRPEWVDKTRARLLAHIERTTEQPSNRVLTLNHLWSALTLVIPQKTVYAYVRPAVIFALCFGLGTAGWITTVSASLNSLPGDALYPVKIATEHTQVAVVDALQGSAASTELHLSFASRRAEEVNKIIDTPNADQAAKQQQVKEAVDNFKNEVQNVTEKLGAVQQASPEVAVAVAKVVDRKTDEIKLTLAAAGGQASTTETVAVIDQLKTEAARVVKEVATANSTSTAAAEVKSVTTTISITPPVVAPTPIQAPTSTPAQVVVPTSTVPIVPAPSAPATPKAPTTIPNIPITEDFPERPKDLSPNVTDQATPIHLEILIQ